MQGKYTNDLYFGAVAHTQDVTIYPSASYNASQNSADLTNFAARGIRVIVDVTDATGGGSITVTIKGKDPASGKYHTLLASAALLVIATTVLLVYPGLTPSANAVASDVLPETYRIEVVANNGNALIYSIGAELLA